jgi:single-strand DNA-binding protein
MTSLKCTALGVLVRDPELRYTSNDKAACNFTLAHSEEWGQGEDRKKSSTFLDVILWGKLAEAFEKYHKKGQMAFVEGNLKQSNWEDKQTGKPRSKIQLTGLSWSFCQTKASQVNRQEEPKELPVYQVNDDSDAPF